jgi:tRNA pseudouridine55 synthase
MATATQHTGVMLLDKPAGPTSRDLLDDLHERTGIGPLGHAGTLDPLASGLLVALAGRARRLQEFFSDHGKTYRARIRFGETSPTLDGEGPVVASGRPVPAVDAAGARKILAGFEGEVLQTPPVFSALRLHGRRAHEIAREGRAVGLEPRKVTIHSIALVGIEEGDWIVDVSCGPGAYVRSLARDLGEARGCGAWLAELRRTRSGPFHLEDAVAPDLATLDHLRPLSEVLASEGRMDVDRGAARRLLQGNVIPRRPGETPTFAWFGDRPCFRLCEPSPGLLRSKVMIEEPPLGRA